MKQLLICVLSTLALILILYFGVVERVSTSVTGLVSPQQVLKIDYNENLVVELINKQRQQLNLQPLIVNPLLIRVAKLQAHNMANQNKLAHELPLTGMRTLTERLDYVGYKGWTGVAENIACNYSNREVVSGWMDSPGHRHNIIGDFTETGVGIETNSRGEPYYCQVFGKR